MCKTKPLSAVTSTEPIARYLFFSKWFNPNTRKVKSAAFMPCNSSPLSVFRILDLSEKEIWEIGQNIIARMATPKHLYGRGEISVQNIVDAELQLISDDKPPRHASILGWPEEKDERKMKALNLANHAKLVLI